MEKSAQEKLARYQQLRTTQRKLYDILQAWLPCNAIEECGKKLGFYTKGKLIFPAEDEVGVLIDYCMHDYRPDGQNVIERYVAQTPIQPDSDESIVLNAMLEARYLILVIDEVVKGIGVQAHDLLRGDSGFIVDIALSETAVKNAILASRIISPGNIEFSMVTCGILPADGAIIKKLAKEIPGRFGERPMDLSRIFPEKAVEFSTFVIRVFVAGNVSFLISDEDISKQGGTIAKSKTGGNDSCFCGCGKKYKKYCG